MGALLGPFPDLVVRVVHAELGHGIALDLDGKFEAFPVILYPPFVGVLLGLHILGALECVGSAKLLDDQTGSWVGSHQRPVLACTKL